jgi:ribonuclease Z
MALQKWFASLLVSCVLSTAWAQVGGDVFKVTLLGTGTPNPSPDRFGPSTLVQAGNLNLMFDAGRGNPVRLWQLKVPMGHIDQVFLTHYHSDHVNGLADLWMTGWLAPVYANRKGPLGITGPTGLKTLTDGLEAAFINNTKVRIADEKLSPEAIRFAVTEFAEGEAVVFERDGVQVSAFRNDHGELIHPSVGYRVDYRGRSVVISGDTRKSDELIKHAKGVDLLVHEVAAARPELLKADPALQPIMDHHTSPREAGEVFSATKPKLAVFTHYVLLANAKFPPMSMDDIRNETRQTYDGPLALGDDLMAFEITDTVKVVPWSGPK